MRVCKSVCLSLWSEKQGVMVLFQCASAYVTVSLCKCV
uniref:Uncharacterized protein n=1 Tax=Anguilla anguilla TaxID=7936 RepID=A0A0E9TDI9_ANGAN